MALTTKQTEKILKDSKGSGRYIVKAIELHYEKEQTEKLSGNIK